MTDREMLVCSALGAGGTAMVRHDYTSHCVDTFFVCIQKRGRVTYLGSRKGKAKEAGVEGGGGKLNHPFVYHATTAQKLKTLSQGGHGPVPP